MVYFLREKIFPLAVFAHGEIPDLTSHLMAWHTCCVHRKYLSSWREETETAIEETCSLYFEEFHWGEEGRWGKNIPQKKKKKKKLARTRPAMEKYWYFMHGNATVHLKNADAEKTKFERKVQEVTWNRWNAERGERALLWDKWAVFL